MAFERLPQPSAVGRLVAREHRDAAAGDEREEELESGDIERHRRHSRQDVRFAEPGPLRHRLYEVRECSMRH